MLAVLVGLTAGIAAYAWASLMAWLADQPSADDGGKPVEEREIFDS